MSATPAHPANSSGVAAASPAVRVPSPSGSGRRSHRLSLTGAVATTATKLLPLVALLDAIQPSVSKESIFRIHRAQRQAVGCHGPPLRRLQLPSATAAPPCMIIESSTAGTAGMEKRA